ncbi:hypothetical protein [Streptomyces chryseus]|uniref:hypothetical protein n=1 Tax=Streptomyces chryseus TaxID=68186 RepID=UPI00110FCCBB|nr:hypothetical protein [Streptomyces chryseus]GGX36545.1 hypothetical protein GCM10010353_59550 [Streptomyces chryseus]
MTDQPTAPGPSVKLCRFAEFGECDRPREQPTGPGRPPEYCDREDHNKVTAFRRRQELKRTKAATTGEQPEPDPARPVDYSTMRARDLMPAARDLLAQQQQLTERQGQIYAQLIEQLDTLADPGAAAVEVENAQLKAIEQVAHAESARLTAEQEATEAKARADEAEDVAETAAELAAENQKQLTEALKRVAEALERAAEAEAAGRERAADAHEQAQHDIQHAAQAMAAEMEQVRAQADERVTTAQAEAENARTEASEATRLAKEKAAEDAERIRAEAAEKVERIRTEAAERIDTATKATEAAIRQANEFKAERDKAVRAQEEATAERDEAREKLKARVKELTKEHAEDRKQWRAELDEERKDSRTRLADAREDVEQAEKRLRDANGTVDQLRRELTTLAHPATGPAPSPAPDLQALADSALLDVAAPFLSGGSAKGLSRKVQTALRNLRLASAAGNAEVLPGARAEVAALGTVKLPDTAEGHRLREALTAYTETAGANTAPDELPGQMKVRVEGAPEPDDDPHLI